MVPDSTAASNARSARRPYERIADAVTTALLVVAIGGAAVGLTRWDDARGFRRLVETRVGERVDALAAAVAKGSPESVEGLAEGLASVHVVTAGGTDDFGISVGSKVAVDKVMDAIAKPADAAVFAQDLLNRSAELDDYHTKKQPIPADRRFAAAELGDDGQALFAAFAPVVKGSEYLGLVRISERVTTPPPSVPGTMVWLGLLLAVVFGLGVSFLPKRAPVREEIVPKRTPPKVKQTFGAAVGATLGRWAAGLQKAFGNPERLGFAAAAGLALLIALGPGLAGSSTGLWLWSSLLAALCGFAAGPGMAAVARGVREQPGTYLYVFPAMIGMIVLVFIPFVMGVALAFFSNGEFTGLSNFAEILSPPATAHTTFYSTTGFTILWTVSNVVLHVVIGVSLALVLNRKHLAFKGLYRVLLVVPWAVPNYITALIWKSMFNPQFGAVNGLLDVFGIEPVNWLGAGSSFASNYIAALTTNTWLGFPFMMVVTLGALQSIPTDLYEAADIDGATRWQKFKKVTLPLLKPALVPAIILGVIWTFNMFNVIYLVSGGAPENETNILVTEAYYAFKVLNRFGLAAAYSLLIFVILLLYGWMQNRITRATEGAFE